MTTSKAESAVLECAVEYYLSRNLWILAASKKPCDSKKFKDAFLEKEKAEHALISAMEVLVREVAK